VEESAFTKSLPVHHRCHPGAGRPEACPAPSDRGSQDTRIHQKARPPCQARHRAHRDGHGFPDRRPLVRLLNLRSAAETPNEQWQGRRGWSGRRHPAPGRALHWNHHDEPRALERSLRTLRRLNRELHRRRPRSRRRNQTRRRLARVHARATNLRRDALHKLTTLASSPTSAWPSFAASSPTRPPGTAAGCC
jgi:Probable transposase